MKFFLAIFCIYFCSNTAAQNADSVFNLAVIAENSGNINSAIKHYNEAISLEPNNSIFWMNRGLCRIKQKNYSLATVDLNKSILLDTSLHEAYFYRSIAYNNTMQYQFALADINHYLENEKNTISAYIFRASLAKEMKEWDVAVRDYEYLYNEKKDSNYLLLYLFCLKENNEFNKAIAMYNEKISIYPDNDFWLEQRAFAFNQAGKYQKSIEDCNQILATDNKKISIIKLKADNYFYLNQMEDALELYKKCFNLDSSQVNYYADLGYTYLQLKQFENAEYFLTKAIQKKCDNLGYALLCRGMAKYNSNKLQEACEDWNKSKLFGEKKAADYLTNHCK